MDLEINQRLNSIEDSMNFINEQFEAMRAKVASLEEENRGLKLENGALKSQLNVITDKLREHESMLDDQEQYLRRECVEIKGIPVQDDEDTNDIVIQVAQLAGVDVQDEDISISHRLPANNKAWKDNDGVTHPPSPPIIIAKFVRRDLKDAIYRARFKLKDKTTRDLEGSTGADNNHIYLSESLTQTRKKLFKSCLKVKKEFKFAITSTSNGRIYFKKNKDSHPVYVRSETDLAKLRRLTR